MVQKHPALDALLAKGAFDEKFSLLYGQEAVPAARERYQRLLEGYRSVFGGEATGFFSAPGRTELGGNHTDHQRGRVLAASVDLDVAAAAAANDDGVIRVFSEGFDQEEISLTDLEGPRGEEINRSTALIRGVAARIRAMGHTIGGFNAYLTSNVPGGSGLSSSAAYEVLLAGILSELYCGGVLTPVELAQIGQYAENVYFGKPSGLMDQCASAVGGVVSIDFADVEHPVVKKIPFDLRQTGYALCILDSGADHADLTGEYAAITSEMRAVATIFGKAVLSEVDEEAFWEAIPGVRAAAGDRAALRAIHFFSDTVLAKREADALQDGDFRYFLELVNRSGRSSSLHLQNVTPTGQTNHQELALTLALCEKCLNGAGACRVHGGGFGGTAQAFVPGEMVPTFRTRMEAVLGENSCHVLSIRPVGFIAIRPEED